MLRLDCAGWLAQRIEGDPKRFLQHVQGVLNMFSGCPLSAVAIVLPQATDDFHVFAEDLSGERR